MRTNYSFLWQYLEPIRLLPILVDKLLMTERTEKEAESYAQKFAQNSVVIRELFASDCPPLKLCDTLDVTGQEHIARKLLQGTHCVGCIYQNCFLSGLCSVLAYKPPDFIKAHTLKYYVVHTRSNFVSV